MSSFITKDRWFDDKKYTKYRLVRFIRTRRLAIYAYMAVVRGSKTRLSDSTPSLSRKNQ